MELWLLLAALLGIFVLLGWIGQKLTSADQTSQEIREVTREDVFRFAREAMRMQDEAHRAQMADITEMARVVGQEIRHSVWGGGQGLSALPAPNDEADHGGDQLPSQGQLFDWTDSFIGAMDDTMIIPPPPADVDIPPYEP